MEYLYVIQQALVWIITIFWLYQLIISLSSFIKVKEKPILEEKNNRFMAIIPAHNEEKVVGNLIASLQKQNYPRDLYDIYVIADNCTDNTAKVAKEAGAIVYERFDEEHKTKGFALNWFLHQKIEENDDRHSQIDGRDSLRTNELADYNSICGHRYLRSHRR